MRNLSLFLAASLGCLVLSAVSFGAPQGLLVTLFPDSNAAKVAQCRSLLKIRFDTGEWPDKGAADYMRYDECYYLICGGTRSSA
ncbi:hypothetical protein X770_02990 [Mesorhizobium sp. LSJC269B00]|nr:hypothetical protein X770_02990 [Mesorhizobium sp. LSJC269B00]